MDVNVNKSWSYHHITSIYVTRFGSRIARKKKGAQAEQHVRLPNVDELVEACGDDLPVVKVVTLAPEMPGGLELTRFLASKGIVLSIGHTNATYAEIVAAIAAGAKHVTHCYNAMRPLDSREPGVVGAAMAHPELLAELIWDNIHVHPASCQALIGAKSTDKVILISDGIPGAGMGDGYVFNLGSHPIEIKNGAARLPDGTLAGSVLTLERAFQNASFYSLTQRAAMTSRNAAVSLGWQNQKGLIREGFDADLVLLSNSGEAVRTIVGGRSVWNSKI